MNGYAELEVSVHRRDSGSYAIDFRFSLPDSDADNRLVPGAMPQFSTSLEDLQNLSHNPSEYGEKLTRDFFTDSNVKEAFTQALSIAESRDLPLRIRLLVGPTAPELQSLRWELLNNPRDGAPLCTNENILFSRYLSSLDWRPVRLRPKSSLCALAFIANPSDLADNNLAAVDVAGEFERARDSLGRIPVDLLPPPDSDQRASLGSLLEELRRTEYDILYLVAHGYMGKDNDPRLVLEDETGKVAITSGSELATKMKGLQQRPRLVVLSSCQSAGKSAGDALRALGPQLAEAGVPAVIAMQGNISMETEAEFMPKFFKELAKDGQIDRAMAVARGEVWDVRKYPDFWMPTLFMRLKSGRIWYVPGFGEGKGGFEKWKAIGRFIKSTQCTPILGPGLYESMLGSQREIAQRWSEEFHYPMAPHERESLPQVAQFLTVNQYQRAPYDELTEYLQSVVKDRYKDYLNGNSENSSLDQMIDVVSTKMRQNNPYEPHEALAKLNLPIYITTNPGNQMAAALAEDPKKDPQVVLCPWNEYTEKAFTDPQKTIYAKEPDYHPTWDRPLVYHLFGRLSEPESVVLTEDDYFDFLIGVTKNNKLIPLEVRAALADTALLFLGFRMDEWNFRVLFRSILSQQGGVRRGMYAHIAAQIEPEEGRILEPERARRYLENYFSQGADISLYWGSPEDFIKELLINYDPNAR